MKLDPKDVYVHTTIAWCNNIWHPDALEAKTGVYDEGVGGTCCFDWFTVKGQKFFRPNQCSGPDIEIRTENGRLVVYDRGSKALPYGDVGALFKDVAQKTQEAVIDPAAKLAKDAAERTKKYAISSWEDTKQAASKFGGYMKTGADATRDFGKMVIDQKLKPLGDTIKEYGSIGATMVKNWFKGRPHHDYCDLSNAVLADPPTLDSEQAQKEDTEGLIPYIKKYAPVVWLQSGEDYYPTRFSEYMTGPGTSIISRKTGATIVPKGQVTMEKIYEMYQNKDKEKYEDMDLAFATDDCIFFGSNPANFTDKNGNLNTPMYVITFEQNNKIYIQYLFFYGLNGPYDIGPFKGNVMEIQNFHEADLEHMTMELNKETKALERIYYASHGRAEGFWLDAKNPDIQYEGTHPVVFVAHYGHGNYPKAGTYVRIFGLANDVTSQGQKWVPTLMRIYKDSDERFDPKTMGLMYFPGVYGKHGVGSMHGQSWFTNVNGDVGRPYTPNKWFCENMPNRDTTSSDPIRAISEIANAVADSVKYGACLAEKIPNATIPD
jgi:hypothetical protein